MLGVERWRMSKILIGAEIVVEQWRNYYNTIRPRSAPRYRPPAPQASKPFLVPLMKITLMQ